MTIALLLLLLCALPASAAIYDVTAYGAIPNDGLNDATAIDAAVAAAVAATRGVVYFPAGTYDYSGAGIDINPAVGVVAAIQISGDGPNVTLLTFQGCSNPQCIRWSTQDATGSASSFGGVLADMAISALSTAATKNLVVVQKREHFEARNIYLYNGTSALTVDETRDSRFEHFQLINWSVNGTNIKGESFTANTFKDFIALGAESATGACLNWDKTSTGDAGGLYASEYRCTGTSAYGFRIHNSADKASVWFMCAHCVAEGNFGTAPLSLKNVRNVRLLNPDFLASASNTYAAIFDNSSEIQFTAGAVYAAAGTSAHFRFLNACDSVVMQGTDVTGTTTVLSTDTTTHTNNHFEFQRVVPTSISNDLGKFQSVTQARSSAYLSGGQTITTHTWTSVAFTVNDYDFGPVHSATTNNTRFTFPAEGQYSLKFHGVVQSNATGLRYCRIRKNGTSWYVPTVATAVNGDVTSVICTMDIGVAKNDYVEFQVYQSSGGNLALAAGTEHTRASVHAVKNW